MLVVVGVLAIGVGCSREVPDSWRDWLLEYHHPLSSLTDVEDFSDLTFFGVLST